jgi:hypothetical protein
MFIFVCMTVAFFLCAWIITPSKENGVDHEVNKLYDLLLGPPKKRVSYGVAADAVMSLETLPRMIKRYMDEKGVDSFTSKSGRFVWLEATERYDILHIDDKTAPVYNKKYFGTGAMIEKQRIEKLHGAYDAYKGRKEREAVRKASDAKYKDYDDYRRQEYIRCHQPKPEE